MSDQVTRVMLATRLDRGVQLNDTYEIDERIASGGMGEVYRGHNIQTGEPVAIKTILPEFADQEAIFALFKREATVLGRLHHDTIVRYYSFSRDPRLGRPYLAMEFVDGISLADRMQNQPLTADEVRRLFSQVADGLALAHGAGVIHRDLSPDNIILRGGDVGRPKIIDFGIARSANVGEGTLIGGGFAGKYNFVSPEQLGIHNREVDARSDIYCLGLVITAALRGKPLDMGGSHVDVIEKRNRLPDLSEVDESLRPLVEAMLQPNPDDRPPDAAAVSQWLRANAPQAERTAQPAGASSGWTGVAQLGVGTPPQPERTSPAALQRTTTGAADATQLIGAGATPFVTSPPAVAASGESPFGSAAAYPTAQGGLPGSTPFQASAGGVRPKSRAGLYAAVAGLVLVLGGGGAAYMAGLVDLGGKSTVVEQTPAEDVATDKVEPAPGASDKAEPAPDTSDKTAISPEHDAIGDALEDFAKAEESSKANPASDQPVTTTQPAGADVPPVTETPVATDTSTPVETPTTTDTPVTPPVTEQAEERPIEAADTTQPATTDKPEDVALAETSDQPPSDTTQDKPAETLQPAETVDPPKAEEETKIAAAGITKMMDVGVSWLRQYDGGKCFFVAVTSVSDTTINIKGFGRDAGSFEKLYNGFMQENRMEPELNGHLINEAQCAAAEFLKKVQPEATQSPQLVLASDRIKVSDPLVMSVSNIGDRALDVLLVHGDGLVYNVKSFAKAMKAGSKLNFQVQFTKQLVETELPEMVIAITSPSGLSIPEGDQHVRAAALFPKLARQVEAMGGDVGVDFAYFQIHP